MIKNEDYTLLNKQISNKDMIKFCAVFEDKQEQYICEVYIKDGPRFTYKYNKSNKEENPFKQDYFKNMNVYMIKFKSKFCRLQYGAETDNQIIFEGDENDETYQYFYTKIDAWISSLKQLRRIKLISSVDYTLTTIYSCLLIVGLTVGYGFLSDFVSRNIFSTIFSSIILGVGLLGVFILYFAAFPPYEIKIGLCKYKTLQKLFYILMTSCIIPIILGLVI